MITAEEREQHIKELQETFNLGKPEAEDLVRTHDAFLEQLAMLPDPKAGIILSITSTIAYAAANDIDPYDFMVLVHEILVQLSTDVDDAPPVAEA